MQGRVSRLLNIDWGYNRGMHTLILFGILYIGTLYAIATLYLPILHIPLAYAIAGLAYAILKQVSLTVEKWREWRYNVGMRTDKLISGLTVAEAYSALLRGDTVYAVAFRPYSPRLHKYTPLCEGAWADPDGRVYFEPSLLTADRECALHIANAERQMSVLSLTLDWASDERVYIYSDCPANRAYALSNAYGYTAQGGKLLVYSERFLPHFPVEGGVLFLPVKGDFIRVDE